jgi:hypothetical protein
VEKTPMPRRYHLLTIAIILIASLVIPFLQSETPASANSCLNEPNGNGCRAGLPLVEYQRLLDEMLLYPEPDVRQLPPNEDELNRFNFHRLTNQAGTTIYDAPGGAPIGQIDAGFNFVSISNSVDGWVEINPGQWVSAADTTPVQPSTFSGVFVDPDSPYTMAWVVWPVTPSSYPGGPEKEDTPRIPKYTRLNIYAEVEVDGWRWYLVGPETWVKQVFVGKALYIDRPEGVKACRNGKPTKGHLKPGPG